MIKLATCKDCKFYKPIDEKRGDCFGHEVQAKHASGELPRKVFSAEEVKEKE